MSYQFTDCFAVPGERTIIDGIHPHTGRSIIHGHTLDQIRERYPGAVVITWDTWSAEQAARQNTPIHWDPTTEQQYHDMLGILPPAAWERGIFLVGEPADHSFSTGRPRYHAYRQRGATYTTSSRPITVAEFRAEVSR